MPERGFLPTYDQKGAFLIALGQEMLRGNLMAGAALDGQSNERLKATMLANGIGSEIAEQILALDLTVLSEAVDDSF